MRKKAGGKAVELWPVVGDCCGLPVVPVVVSVGATTGGWGGPLLPGSSTMAVGSGATTGGASVLTGGAVGGAAVGGAAVGDGAPGG